MNPDLSAEAKNNAMARLGTMVFDDESDNRDVPASVTENYNPNNPVDVMRLLIFAGQNNVSYPGNEDMVIQVEDDGRVSDIEISKAQSKQVFSDNAQGGIESVNELNAASVTEPVASQASDPFLDVDFASMVDQTGVGMGSSAPTNLNDAQRAALAGGNLDEAIALGNRGMV